MSAWSTVSSACSGRRTSPRPCRAGELRGLERPGRERQPSRPSSPQHRPRRLPRAYTRSSGQRNPFVSGPSSKGFRWPLDLVYAQPQPTRTVLGYSTDGRVYHSVPPLQPAQLQPGTAVGWYADPNRLTHPADADTVPHLPVQAARLGRSHLHLAARPGARDRVPLPGRPHPGTGVSCCSRDSPCIPRPGSRAR